jgi:hypothetical protein
VGFGAARSVATGGAPGFPAFPSAPGVQANPTTAIALAQEGYQRGLEKFPRLRCRAQSRTSGSNLLSRTRSIPSGIHDASLAQWVTAGCQSMDTSRGRKKPDITRKASPVQYPIATSLLPMSLRLGGWPAADTINSRRSLAGGIRSG